ncbi:MAG: peptidase and in kexin sedolisin [Ilumatobacteraceae bacterium]|nr:peptidase and in kexin sedolisin [Ilumatobacteraceae bacterium]
MTPSSRQRRTRVFGLAAVAALAMAVPTSPTVHAGSSATDPATFTATGLSPSSTAVGAKSTTGRLAETDPTLLGRTDATPVNVVVKLDYDATASYTGDVEGFAATSPRVTGRKLTGHTPAEVSYEGYTAGIDREFRGNVASHIPGATAGRSLQRVYGGVALTVPANQVSALLALPDVAAVQVDQLNHVDTDSSTSFIGAPTIWSQDGGQALAGHGVIFGDLDTGLWPEHPSFTDNPALGNPPAKADGTPRECNFGDNPLTPAVDPFVCNHKLIGGENFLTTYNTVVGGETFPDSARDSDGHGTHTSSTAAGDIVASAPIFGIDHGPISGVAPGAWVIEYKVCGLQGCFGSDSAAAVEQAIVDGVNVINFSIGGGSHPYSDPVELAFLDAYDAGVLVSASAGNSGPAAATTEHVGPWVITVAASTQSREFDSTLTVTSGADSATFVGASIGTGVSASTPIVLAQDIPGYDALCSAPLPPGTAANTIVACQRGGNGRVEKGFNVAQGGAAGMILYNSPLADVETDNHFLPAVHLADGTAFLAFMAAHAGAPVAGSFTPGAKATGQGDVMAAFSSRGPGGQFLKPDITAPGVQILAGNTPVPDDVAAGPSGEYYQAIAGTSMSSPHIAGSAILLASLHPDWSPGAIKSALMTTATTNVVKEDLVTPADPFDDGAGRVDLTQAGATPVVFDESALRMYQLGNDPVTALDVNTPSVNVPTMPGTVRVLRTATNVTGKKYDFKISTVAPTGSKIRVVPDRGTIKPGKSQTFQIFITSNAPSGQYFGSITLDGGKRVPTLHLPVAFFNQQGSVTLQQACSPTSVKERQTTTCTVTAANQSFGDATVGAASIVNDKLKIVGATGATVDRRGTAAAAGPVTLTGQKDAVPAIDPTTGSPAGGFLDLAAFGIPPSAIGDEDVQNFTVPEFTFGGKTYSSIGVDSNGYLVLGGGDTTDNGPVPQTFPNPDRPNGVLAPYWTDLDGTDADGVRVATLVDGPNNYVAVQWNVHIFGHADQTRSMQVWLGTGATVGAWFEYGADTDNVAAPADPGLTVGAENASGTAGAQLAALPTGSYAVTTTPGAPGGTLTYTLTVRGDNKGHGVLTTSSVSDIVAGLTTVSTNIDVTRR